MPLINTPSSSSFFPSHPPSPIPIRLVTHNVRFASAEPTQGEEPWAVRCPRICAQLRFLAQARGDSVFICLQEALYPQLQDILAHLNGDANASADAEADADGAQEWAYIGVGRDDGQVAGEFSPVLYRGRVWACERWRTYWLSETPDVPGSKGWDANNVRLATVGQFRLRAWGRGPAAAAAAATAARVVVISTHLDHIGKVAKRESAKLLLRIADEWGGERRLVDVSSGRGSDTHGILPPPLFLGGDFNSTPEDVAYKTIVGGGTSDDDHDDNDGGHDGGGDGAEGPGAEDGQQRKRITRGMTDVSQVVPASLQYGNRDITFTGFGGPEEGPERIDFLFARGPATMRFLNFVILPNRFDDGIFLSDHRAVVADVEILTPRLLGWKERNE